MQNTPNRIANPTSLTTQKISNSNHPYYVKRCELFLIVAVSSGLTTHAISRSQIRMAEQPKSSIMLWSVKCPGDGKWSVVRKKGLFVKNCQIQISSIIFLTLLWNRKRVTLQG